MKALGKWILAGLAPGLLAAALARPAQACGGLFCSSANPVNQAAERIIFSFDKAAKSVTAVVEIMYQGPADKFAWVLPVPGIPEVGVSTSALLDRLQSATNPLYNLQRDFSMCGGRGSPQNASPGSAVPPNAGPSDPSGPKVSVLASGAAGPYEYTVIEVNPALSDRAMAAIQWLTDNKFEVGKLGADVLRPYLNEGLNLIAFKLAKSQTAGSIRPILLTYKSEHPMIPIRPTAVAANPDMGVLTFVLGESRAIPTNYKNLELNEAAIDWFNPNNSYNAVVTAAANEAGGQGFVTEMAASSANLANQLFQERGVVENYRRTADGLSNPNLIIAVIEAFSTFSQGNFGGPFVGRPSGGRVALDGVQDTLAKHLTLPAGVKIEDVMASPRCYLLPLPPGNVYCEGKEAPKTTIDLATFNRIEFMKSVEDLVIKPIEKTVKLFEDQPYLTRLYTTLSAEEMTLDPEFDLNSELGDVSNLHSITLKYKGCPGGPDDEWETEVGGFLVRGKGNTWPIDPRALNMKYNVRVTQLMVKGPAVEVANNRAEIAAKIGGMPGQPQQPGSKVTPSVQGSCSMGTGGGSSAGLLWLLAGVALLVMRRRR